MLNTNKRPKLHRGVFILAFFQAICHEPWFAHRLFTVVLNIFFLFEQTIKPLICIPSVSFVHSQPLIVHLYQKINKISINRQSNLSLQKGHNCFTVNLATVCLSAPWETTRSGSGRSVLHSGRKCSLLIKTCEIIFFQQKWELLIKCLVIGEALHQMLADWVSLDSDYMHIVFHFVKLWILTGGSM